jgi:preprotein translocase SecE subunit
MAKQEMTKGSKVWEMIKKDYPAYTVIMGVLGVLVFVFGIYIIMGINNPENGWLFIQNRTAWWSKWIFGTDTRILVFGYVITTIGIVAFAMAAYPLVRPSVLEMKRVSWPKSKTIQNHSARVFGFILFVAAMFMIYEVIFNNLFAWIRG